MIRPIIRFTFANTGSPRRRMLHTMSMGKMNEKSVVIYFLRRDLRLEDNPVFHALATNPEHKFDHLLPVYVFPAQQVEVSGFIPSDSHEKSPYPEAKSAIGRFWRTGPHRAKFLCESVWALKESLQNVGIDIDIRAGHLPDTLLGLITRFQEKDMKVTVWMTQMLGNDEAKEEKDCEKICQELDIGFKIWKDEKYLIDDDDINKRFSDPKDLPDVFTTWRKMVEPLRDNARDVLPTPKKNSLPPLPPSETILEQRKPFVIPQKYIDLVEAILLPLVDRPGIKNPPPKPESLNSAYVYEGGTKRALERIDHLLKTGSMTNYKATRNGLLGLDFSTKLSAWLSLGCITARQVHAEMYSFEEGTLTNPEYAKAEGWGEGENEGTKAVRFELAWRDYMRLCHKKFGTRINDLGGFKQDTHYDWKKIDNAEVRYKLDRFLNGTTGMGLIDASQRELYLTGYTSNRARQNVASYLSKHLGIDWRIGAEWYENMLIDHDVSNNWGNWQYVAGVGNDPRSTSRVFNSVKQAADYDPKGEYVYHWIPEFQKDKHGQKTELVEHESQDEKKAFRDGYRREQPVKIEAQEVYRAYTMYEEKLHRMGLDVVDWVTNPLIKIEYTPGKLTSKPGQRERWRRVQEEKEQDQERMRNGQLPKVKQSQIKKVNGKADHRDGDGNNGNGRNGRGGTGGGAGGGAPPGGNHPGPSSSGHANGNGASGSYNNHSRNQSSGNGSGGCTQHSHDGQGGRRNSGPYTNGNWHLMGVNSYQNHRGRPQYSNYRGSEGRGGYKGWVSERSPDHQRRMMGPPPGLPPRNFDPSEAAVNAYAGGMAPPAPWGHPLAISAAHCGMPPGLAAAGVPPEQMIGVPPGLAVPEHAISPPPSYVQPSYGPAHVHYQHYPGPRPIQHPWPQWMSAQLMEQRAYNERMERKWRNSGPQAPILHGTGAVPYNRGGYTPDTGVMELSRTMGRMGIGRRPPPPMQQMSWRQPS